MASGAKPPSSGLRWEAGHPGLEVELPHDQVRGIGPERSGEPPHLVAHAHLPAVAIGGVHEETRRIRPAITEAKREAGGPLPAEQMAHEDATGTDTVVRQNRGERTVGGRIEGALRVI